MGKRGTKAKPKFTPRTRQVEGLGFKKAGREGSQWERMQKEEEVLERVHFLCRSGCVGVRREGVESNMSTWVSPPTVTVT